MSYKINYSTEEKIKLAKDDSVEKLYESKKNQRTVRVLTVLAYVLTVSMAAIILSSYYVFFWKPNVKNSMGNAQVKPNCDKIIIPEHIAVRLLNNTVISLDSFYNHTMMHLQRVHSKVIKEQAGMRDRNEFNRYLETMAYEEAATTISMDGNKEMYQKMKIQQKRKHPKKIVDDEDLNLDMESSGDKDQLLITTFQPPTSEPTTDMNDTTIIFDQEPEE